MSVVIETTIGDITVDLYLKERPNTCLNFLKLCKIKYYNLCLFYKIEKNFIAQSGDPTATGRGGESIFCHLYGDQAKYFDAEFKPRLKHIKLGTLSMVNNGNNMNGSQFFITLSENLTYLDESHTVFGEVAEGLDVLVKLNDAICDNNNRPYQDIRITHTVILHDPFEDPKGLEIPDASPEPTKEMLESNYIAPDEEIDENKGKTTEEIEEKIKESEAKARATILEMVGDIPDADVKPPENVLFVCKLNPVTTSEDLEIIFSRFGKIVSCEVIKDKKTGDSLQYAFIEFEREEDCEAAYFKMDNVLIDDRRIHVDFSQSVSKMNFGQDKFKSSKKQSKSNVLLKNTDRADGYNLIFDMEDDVRNHKQKSKELASKSETSSKRKKHRSHSKEREYKKQSEQFSYEKNYKNVRNDKRSKYGDWQSSHSSDRIRNNDYYSESKNRQTSKYSNKDLKSDRHSRSYRDSDYHKKSSESYSNECRSSQKKSRYDSISPDRRRRSHDRYREQPPYNSHSREKNSEYSAKTERSKSFKSSEQDRMKISSEKFKKDVPIKAHLREKQKKSKMSRRSSSSSSSSDSNSSSSSSSSSSTSSSSDYKPKKKSRYRKQEFSDSKNRSTNQKKRKYST